MGPKQVRASDVEAAIERGNKLTEDYHSAAVNHANGKVKVFSEACEGLE